MNQKYIVELSAEERLYLEKNNIIRNSTSAQIDSRPYFTEVG